jgi:hypothetical protein
MLCSLILPCVGPETREQASRRIFGANCFPPKCLAAYVSLMMMMMSAVACGCGMHCYIVGKIGIEQ